MPIRAEDDLETEPAHRGSEEIVAVSDQRAVSNEMLEVRNQEFLQDNLVEGIVEEDETVSRRKFPICGVRHQKEDVFVRRLGQILFGDVYQRSTKIDSIDFRESEIFLGQYARLALPATDIHEVLKLDARVQRLSYEGLQVKTRIWSVIIGIRQRVCRFGDEFFARNEPVEIQRVAMSEREVSARW